LEVSHVYLQLKFAYFIFRRLSTRPLQLFQQTFKSVDQNVQGVSEL
jgi:hypothetical protein